jgi:hypothetical protein
MQEAAEFEAKVRQNSKQRSGLLGGTLIFHSYIVLRYTWFSKLPEPLKSSVRILEPANHILSTSITACAKACGAS